MILGLHHHSQNRIALRITSLGRLVAARITRAWGVQLLSGNLKTDHKILPWHWTHVCFVDFLRHDTFALELVSEIVYLVHGIVCWHLRVYPTVQMVMRSARKPFSITAMNESREKTTVTVVGAGIVGVCCALQLQQEGYQVTIIDPKPPGTATSYGNAGVIATGTVVPYATPGLWKRLPWMLLSPMSPVSLPWSNLHRSLPWIARFLASGTRARVDVIAGEVAPLVAQAGLAHKRLIREHQIDSNLIQPRGFLYLFDTQQDFDDSALDRELCERHEVAFDVLEADEISQLEPGLAKRFHRGIFYPDKDQVVQPIALTEAYVDAFLSLGGQIRHETVRRFEMGTQGPTKVVTDLGIHPIDRLVIAAGAWSRELTRLLGTDLPLETERGYHLNVAWGEEVTLNRPVCVANKYFVMVPMRDGVRVTSGDELGGLKRAPDFTRIRRILTEARATLKGLNGEVTREWMGYRPSLPDSKPVIGRSPHFPRVFYAFGHGHLGLTLAAISAKLVADLVAGRQSEFPLDAFRVDRF